MQVDRKGIREHGRTDLLPEGNHDERVGADGADGLDRGGVVDVGGLDLVEAQRLDFPPGVVVTYSQDKSTDIRTMLGDLQNNVLSAVLLVMIVIVGALGLRSGLT